MRKRRRAAEVFSSLGSRGSDDIPAGAPTTDLIDRCECPRKIVGFGILSRRCGDQTQMARLNAEGCEQCQGLQAQHETRVIVEQASHVVSKKYEIEFAALGPLRNLQQQWKV